MFNIQNCKKQELIQRNGKNNIIKLKILYCFIA